MSLKLWTASELLTSVDLNGVSRQTVIVCTSSTRPASPVDGMTIYETDTDRYVSWNGSGWVIALQTTTGTYTATLTATTTNPNLGTGGAAQGRYLIIGGKWVHVRWTINFGTSGSSAGSGQYLIALPFGASSGAISPGVSTCGQGVVRAAGSLSPVTYYIAAGSTTMAAIIPSGANVTSGSPGAFTNNDYLSGSITYETS